MNTPEPMKKVPQVSKETQRPTSLSHRQSMQGGRYPTSRPAQREIQAPAPNVTLWLQRHPDHS